jgi:hypothetical protein
MNIFYLDHDPAIAAKAMHDRHIIKMISESCQLLSVWADYYRKGFSYNLPEIDPELPREIPWTQLSHTKHPCALWLNEGPGNVRWLLDHLYCLLVEYDYRFGKLEKFTRARQICVDLHEWFLQFAFVNHTCPKACYPDIYKNFDKYDGGYCRENVMQGYRRYYIAEKLAGNKYTKREPPVWAKQKEKAPPPEPIDFSKIIIKPKLESKSIFVDMKAKTVSAASIKIVV